MVDDWGAIKGSRCGYITEILLNSLLGCSICPCWRECKVITQVHSSNLVIGLMLEVCAFCVGPGQEKLLTWQAQLASWNSEGIVDCCTVKTKSSPAILVVHLSKSRHSCLPFWWCWNEVTYKSREVLHRWLWWLGDDKWLLSQWC